MTRDTHRVRATEIESQTMAEVYLEDSSRPRIRDATTVQQEVQPLQRHEVIPSIPPNLLRQGDEEPTTFDQRYLNIVRERSYHLAVQLHPIGFHTISTSLKQAGPHWPDFTFASKAFRFATLAFGSSLSIRDLEHRDVTCNYLTKFYKYQQEAIDKLSLMEIFVASYAALLCAVQTGDSLQTITTFIEGLCITCELLLKNSSVSLSELDFINKLLLSGIDTLRFQYFVCRDPFENYDFDLIAKLHATLNFASLWHCSQLPYGPVASEANLLVELLKLDLYMKFHLDHYLAVMQQSESDDEIHLATTALRQVLSEIIELVHRMSRCAELFGEALNDFHQWPWETDGFWMDTSNNFNYLDFYTCKIAFVFGLARTLLEIIDEKIAGGDANGNAGMSSGLFLCRLFALQLSQSKPRWVYRSVAHYLFWAGLGLKRGIEDDGSRSSGDCSLKSLAARWIWRVLTVYQEWLNTHTFNHDRYFKALFKALNLGQSHQLSRVLLLKSREANILRCNLIGEKLAFSYVSSVPQTTVCSIGLSLRE